MTTSNGDYKFNENSETDTTDLSEYFSSDSEEPDEADDESVSKVEELVDQALDQITSFDQPKESFDETVNDAGPVEPSDYEEDINMDELASQSEISFSSEFTESVKLSEPVFRPTAVYKKKATTLTDEILTKSLIQFQNEITSSGVVKVEAPVEIGASDNDEIFAEVVENLSSAVNTQEVDNIKSSDGVESDNVAMSESQSADEGDYCEHDLLRVRPFFLTGF